MIILYESVYELELIPKEIYNLKNLVIRPSDEFYKELMGMKQ
jgi:hypothetical protein